MDLVKALAAVAAEEAMLVMDAPGQAPHGRTLVTGAYLLAFDVARQVGARSEVMFALSDVLNRFRTFCTAVEESSR